MHASGEPLSDMELSARRRNALKSTGPRTAAGKRRVSRNALKYGLYSQSWSDAEKMFDLGEDPREFEAFVTELIAALEPADAVERMLAQDVATLAWKKRRLDRAQAGLQLHNLELLELERHRQALQLGRDTPDLLQAEVLKVGLRRASKSPANFGEILSHLDLLSHAVEEEDFSEDAGPIFTGLYGESPTLRGAQIIHLYERFQSEDEPATPEEREENQALRACLKIALLEEKRDVIEEYALYMQENVNVSPALRDATLAPTNPGWQTLIRHEYTLDRLIERKLRLLAERQKARRRQEAAAQQALKRRETPQKRFCQNKASHLVENKAWGSSKSPETKPVKARTKRVKLLKSRKRPANKASLSPKLA